MVYLCFRHGIILLSYNIYIYIYIYPQKETTIFAYHIAREDPGYPGWYPADFPATCPARLSLGKACCCIKKVRCASFGVSLQSLGVGLLGAPVSDLSSSVGHITPMTHELVYGRYIYIYIWFSHDFPIFLWFSYSFPMIFPFSYTIPMVFLKQRSLFTSFRAPPWSFQNPICQAPFDVGEITIFYKVGPPFDS